jgi:hypothetical protein
VLKSTVGDSTAIAEPDETVMISTPYYNRKTMNKLKKLFSPSALSATLATGMLLTSAVVALAGNICSQAYYLVGDVPCEYDTGGQFMCSALVTSITNCEDAVFYWCCPSDQAPPNQMLGYSCGGLVRPYYGCTEGTPNADTGEWSLMYGLCIPAD